MSVCYNQNSQQMSLELLLGPMFAGKSSAILSIVRRHRSLGWPVMVITHACDTRYGTNQVVNHDQERVPAIAVGQLMPLTTHEEYAPARLIVIEEAQFFGDLVEFVLGAVEGDGKHVVVVGLDGDAERRPFGRVLELMPFADRITKLTSFCRECSDGTPAIFTFAHDDAAAAAAGVGEACVGAQDKYVPMCRKHYLAHRRRRLNI